MRPATSFIQQPVRSLQTMLQVIALSDPRLPVLIPDGIYSQATISAVNRFQQLYDLPITGITDQTTWDKIVEIYESAIINANPAEPIEILIDRNQSLKPGDSGPYVSFLQIMLQKLSEAYPSIPSPALSGTYEKDTIDAVRSFQKINGLTPTGITNKETWKHIEKQFTLLMHISNYKKLSIY